MVAFLFGQFFKFVNPFRQIKMMNPKVDAFFSNVSNWKGELTFLRKIMLDCGLREELKWGNPCYTFQNANVALLHGFKAYCGIGFFKGVLLQDSEGILSKPGENTQSSRIIKFTNIQEIVALETSLKAYIFEAIEVEKAGLQVETEKNPVLKLPEEFQKKLEEDPGFKAAFFALTPGRQRAYNLFFSAAKQSETRESRVEKYRQQILNGKGITDCTCGLSKKMPSCDGSHKFFTSRNN